MISRWESPFHSCSEGAKKNPSNLRAVDSGQKGGTLIHAVELTCVGGSFQVGATISRTGAMALGELS